MKVRSKVSYGNGRYPYGNMGHKGSEVSDGYCPVTARCTGRIKVPVKVSSSCAGGEFACLIGRAFRGRKFGGVHS